MAEDNKRSLVQSRNYCIDRLTELKAELGSLQDEGTELKAALEASVDAQQAGLIRRRRMYLSRRIGELKEEREALTTERQSAVNQLAALTN